jgi:trk system potassium uptake protein TrkA
VYIVILGCGRVGTALAKGLLDVGHAVAVVDQDPSAFRRLGADFRGRTVAGVGFDREVLVEAGIEQADAFAAVSSGDNSNIIAARVARETFGVQRVAARIYDPGRAEVYERLGIPTVATVRWTADQMMRKLLPHSADPAWVDPSGRLLLTRLPLGTAWTGRSVGDLERATGSRVSALTRSRDFVTPHDGLALQEGDVVHLMVRVDRRGTVEHVVTAVPEGGR